MVDQEFIRAAKAAGVDPNVFAGDDPGTGYEVTLFYAGAYDKSAVVFASYNTAKMIAEAVIEEEQDVELEASITHVYSDGEGFGGATGYGPYGHFRWDEDTETVIER